MAKIDGINIQRIQRQHSSLLVVIPIAVRRVLGLRVKDYIVFHSHPGTNVVEFSKFEPGDKNHGKGSGDSS